MSVPFEPVAPPPKVPPLDNPPDRRAASGSGTGRWRGADLKKFHSLLDMWDALHGR